MTEAKDQPLVSLIERVPFVLAQIDAGLICQYVAYRSCAIV
jgi:hypothetical protein